MAERPDYLRIRSGLGKTSKRFRVHALAVGELVWSSNFCLWCFNMLYRSLFNPDTINIAVRTWYGQRSDRAQIDLVECAVRGNRRLTRRKAEAILWAVAQAREIAGMRNDAVHVFVNVRKDGRKQKIEPSPHTTVEKKLANLAGIKNLTRHFRVVRDDFIRLADYVFILWLYSDGTHLQPLPTRPRLRCLLDRHRASR